MTSDNRSAPDAVVDTAMPDARARLAVPMPPAEDPQTTGAGRTAGAPRSTFGAPGAAPRRAERSRKLTPLKRLERYLSAIFKLGRTESMAKDARSSLKSKE